MRTGGSVRPRVAWLKRVGSLTCLLKCGESKEGCKGVASQKGKSGESKEGCKGVASQKGKRGKNQQSSCAHASSFGFDSFRNREPVMLL